MSESVRESEASRTRTLYERRKSFEETPQEQRYRKQEGNIEIALVYNHYATFSVRSMQLLSFLVTKSEETTRSHPEHGRKDSHR